ncbi:MAG: hypothetical protein KC421_08445 [Anaerolineales bacterium]|nr:hypothetical protein [Anaerolineales bacterium]
MNKEQQSQQKQNKPKRPSPLPETTVATPHPLQIGLQNPARMEGLPNHATSRGVRQATVLRMQQRQGNTAVQRYLARSNRSKSTPAISLDDQNEFSDMTTGGSPTLTPTPPLPPASNGNGNGNGANNGTAVSTNGTSATIQREVETDDLPTEEEKAAALSKAKDAAQKAAQAKNTSKAEAEKSHQQKQAEKGAAQAAKQKGQTEKAATGSAQEKGKGAGVNKMSGGKKTAVNGTAPPPLPQPEIPGAVVDKAPTSPEEDPAFQAVVGNIKNTGQQQKKHVPAASKAAAAQASVETPAAEIEGRAQSNQMGEMDAAETPAFDKAAFKAKLMQRIEAMSPKTAEEADEFKSSNKAGAIKGELEGEVDQKEAASKGALEETTAAPPSTEGIEPKPVTPLSAEEPGQTPGGVGAKTAVPKPKGKSELETPLEQGSKSIDQQMVEADVTEKQLAESNEPEFVSALESKKTAQAEAKAAPQAYRQYESDTITQAEGEAEAVSQEKTEAMHADRTNLFNQVAGQQTETKSEDEKKRQKVAADIQKIYSASKSKVESILAKMDQDVDQTFEQGATAAKQTFEDYIESETEAHKQKRYGGWLGWARWVKDKFKADPEINRIAQRAKNIFIKEMDAVVDNVVEIIARGLAEAKAEIAKGKKEIQAYVDKLPADLQQVGQEAASDVQDKFDALETSVDNKQDELIESLASKYKEKLDAVNARVEEIKEANKGLIDKAVDAIAGAIKTILRLKDMLLSVLAKVASVVMSIIKAPIRFLGNLISGVKQGFQNFAGNILKHLQTGFIAWLTGALGPMNITLPDDIFSLEGMFSLIVQILGLTWDYIRAKAVKLLGEPVVKALETGFEMFQILINEGPAGLWKLVQEQFSDLKSMVIDQIKNIIVEQVIKGGIKWILGLLNPASALIKAAIAIYDIVMFIVERGSQIMEMVNAFIGSIAAVVSGNVSAMAAKIEQALAKALPLAIGFLANLLGIGGIAKKVQKVIKGVRKKIDKAIDKLILKAKKFGKKLLKQGEVKDEDTEKGKFTEKDRKVGLAAFEKEEKPFAKEGTISKENATKVAGIVKQKHPVFKSITIADGKDSWNYKYIFRSDDVDTPTKKAEVKEDKLHIKVGDGVIIKHFGDIEVGEVDEIQTDGLVWFKMKTGQKTMGSRYAMPYEKIINDPSLVQHFDGPITKGNGPYKHLEDPPNVGPFKPFTSTQKAKIIQENMNNNDDKLVSDETQQVLVPATVRQKGVKIDPNEVQIDHIFPRSKGGWNSYANAQVLSASENLKKLDTIPNS